MYLDNYDYLTILDWEHCKLVLTFESSNFQDFVHWLADTTDAKGIAESWRSKYNDYCAYDYKPFSTSGFNYVVELFYKVPEQMEYADYILTKEVEIRSGLEKLLLTAK